MKRLFKSQTYEWIPIGSMEDLNSADLNYAQEFYSKYYSPDNAVIVIAGDIEYEQTRSLVKRYFEELKPANTKKNSYPAVKFNQGEVRDVIFDNVQLPAMYISYKIPGTSNKESRALEVLSLILGDGRSSRLYNDIVYEKKASKSAGSFVWDNEKAGMIVIYATGFKNTDLDTLETEITALVDKLSKENVLDRELEKAKNSIENDYTNNMQTILGKADALASYWTFYRNTSVVNTIMNEYLSLTKDDLLNAAKKYLSVNNRVVLFYKPNQNGKVN